MEKYDAHSSVLILNNILSGHVLVPGLGEWKLVSLPADKCLGHIG